MSDRAPGPAYRIQTRRMVIRCYNPTDAPLLKAAIDESLDHLREWMPWAKDEPEDMDKKVERLRFFRGRFDLGLDFIYGIFNPDESRQLGSTGLHKRLGEGALEIGYWIHKDYINLGLATEAAAALVRVAFEVEGCNRVEIHCDPANGRSAAVPRKLGFVHEATLRRRYPFHERLTDLMMWTLFKEDYHKSPAAEVEIEAFDAAGRQII